MANSKKEGTGKEPQYIPSPLHNPMLNYKIYYMSAFEKCVYFLLVFVLGGFVGWVFYGGLFKVDGEATNATFIGNIVIFMLFGLAAVRIFLPAVTEMLKTRRDKALRMQFRDMLETLTASLASGNTVVDSFLNAQTDMQNQYSESDYIIAELTEVRDGLQNGQTLEAMLVAFSDRTGNEDIQNFANVISNCYRIGGDFKAAVRKTKEIIGDKMAIEEEIETKLSSNKLQHNAMCIMPVVLVAMLKLSSETFADNLASFLGVAATTLAIAIFVGAYFWGRKIIEIR